MWKKKYISNFIDFDSRRLPKGCHVATMTIYLKIKNKDITIDLQSFYDNINEQSPIKYIEYENKFKNYGFEKKKTKKKKSNFQNSLSLYIKIKNNFIHFNFFKNGTIHGTGIKCIEDFIDAVVIIKNQITLDLEIDTISISMININFILPYVVNKNILKLFLKNKKIPYNINKTQNISIYFYTTDDKEILITIHKNSLIISKCTCEKDIIESYSWITNLLHQQKDNLIDISVEEVLNFSDLIRAHYNGK